MRYLIVLLAAVVTTAPAHAQWANEPSGSQRVVDCSFSVFNCAGSYTRGTWLDPYGVPLATISSAPLSPSSVADAALYYPNTIGGTDLGWYDNQADREIYMGAYFMWTGTSSSLVGFTKMFFLRTTNTPFGNPLLNGVFLIEGRDPSSRRVIFGVNPAPSNPLNNGHVCTGDPNSSLCYPNVGSGNFAVNAWVKLEACVRASTTSTSQDGVLRWWIDGVLAGDYRNLNYGGPNVNEWWWSQTWDGFPNGNGYGFTSDAHQYLDHLVVSLPPDGGCAGGGSTPPPLPAAPSNLRFQSATVPIAPSNLRFDSLTIPTAPSGLRFDSPPPSAPSNLRFGP